MLLNNRSFSQDFNQQFQQENEPFILGMKMILNPTNVIIRNRDNASTESNVSKVFVMKIACEYE